MSIQTKIALTAAASAIAALSAPAFAQNTQTNTMTNIVTIVDACDIVAIGVDFGAQPGSITSDITGLAANTTVGNLVTGNTTHPDAGADGGAGNDDELGLNTPVAALNTAIGTVLSTVVGTAPGVYVACTSTPSSLTVAGTDATATLDLTTAGAVTPNTDFDSELVPASTAAGATGSIDYSLSFTGVVVSTDLGITGAPALFTGAYVATGTIPAATNTDVKTAGFYSDVATATLTF